MGLTGNTDIRGRRARQAARGRPNLETEGLALDLRHPFLSSVFFFLICVCVIKYT